jgi:hypothetical protein
MEEEIQGKYLGYLDSIQDLIKDIQAGDVQGIPEQKLAELNNLYQQAQEQFTQGIGSFQPFVDSATGTIGSGVEALDKAATAFEGLGKAPTREQLDPFINPFQDVVRDEINRAYDIAANEAAAGAIESGAFGGGREGVQRAELERGRADALARAQAQAFGQGLSNFLASQQASAAGLGGLGREFGGLGGAQAGLGFDTQRAGIADVSTLLDFANLQQQQAQKGLDVNYANQLAQYQQPFTELGFLGSAFGYAPSIPQFTTAGGGGSVSPLQQIIGYGSLGLGALSGLKGLQGLF